MQNWLLCMNHVIAWWWKLLLCHSNSRCQCYALENLILTQPLLNHAFLTIVTTSNFQHTMFDNLHKRASQISTCTVVHLTDLCREVNDETNTYYLYLGFGKKLLHHWEGSLQIKPLIVHVNATRAVQVVLSGFEYFAWDKWFVDVQCLAHFFHDWG